MIIRQILKEWYLYLTDYRWSIGVAEYDPKVILTKGKQLKIHWIKGTPKTRWFADPFILSKTPDQIQILVEDVLYATGKGVISKLTIDIHNWRLLNIETVLELSTHLSFPIYFRKDGKVYIYPESTRSGKLTLYAYDEQSGDCHEEKILADKPLADAVLWNHQGEDLILATTAPDDNGRHLDLYKTEESTDGSYFYSDRIKFDTRVARNAGIPFEINGKLYRPAQDCTESYGKCVVIQEMREDGERIDFKEVRRFYSRRFNYWEGFHTFNVFDDELIAVDALGFRYGLIPCVVSRIRKWFK